MFYFSSRKNAFVPFPCWQTALMSFSNCWLAFMPLQCLKATLYLPLKKNLPCPRWSVCCTLSLCMPTEIMPTTLFSIMVLDWGSIQFTPRSSCIFLLTRGISTSKEAGFSHDVNKFSFWRVKDLCAAWSKLWGVMVTACYRVRSYDR